MAGTWWLKCGWYMVYIRLTWCWNIVNTWLKCHWLVADMSMTCGSYISAMWLTYGRFYYMWLMRANWWPASAWHVAVIWLISFADILWLTLAEMWLKCGKNLEDKLLLCGCYLAEVKPTFFTVMIVCQSQLSPSDKHLVLENNIICLIHPFL